MRIAWFAAASASSVRLNTPGPAAPAGDHIDPSNDTALLMRALRARHTIDAIDASGAHDFVWQHARRPYDLCVFELAGTSAHDFVAPYAVHYPGIVLLRGLPRHDRALRASRLVVVPHEPVAQAIADDYPGTRVRTLTPGVEPLPADAPDVITALNWPPDARALTYALAGVAAGRAVIVFDGPETADWPSLDPQNWQPRTLRPDLPRGEWPTPICVSIDSRDQAHSVGLALRRLESDPALRARLGAAARAWWQTHATVERATTGFEALLDEACTVPPIGIADADEGMSLARGILEDFPASNDVGMRHRDLGI